MKYQAKQLRDGNWAVFSGKSYWRNTVTENERNAKVEALHMSGRWHGEQIDKIDNALRELDAFNESDGHGYMC